MDNLIKIADYVLALQENNVTEEIRNNFSSTIVDETTALEKFALLVKNILPQVNKTLSVEQAFVFIQTEYTNLPFAFYIDDFEEITSFINLLLMIRNNRLNTRVTIDSLNQYLNIANNISNQDIKTGIYIAILRALIFSNSITEDINFSKEIVAYVKEYGQSTFAETMFSEIVSNALSDN